jgi:hypothetical protein
MANSSWTLAAVVALAAALLLACGGGSDSSGEQQPGIPGEHAVLLNWLPPTERVDGSPIGELIGYRILYGRGSGDYQQTIFVNSPGIASYVVEGLGPGMWYFAVVSVTADGLWSVLSNEVSTRI